MSYRTMEPATGEASRTPSRTIGIYRLAYRNGHQIMLRIPRGALEKAGWAVGQRVNVEFDESKKRLRLTHCAYGSYKIGGKGKSSPGDTREGRLRWTSQPGRPTTKESFTTENWRYRSTDDAIIINVDQMEIQE